MSEKVSKFYSKKRRRRFMHVSFLFLIAFFSTSSSFAKELAPKMRNFYEVLEDVIGDFEYDVKNGEVKGLKDITVRNIATSENIPPSFKQHVELLVTERIIKNTNTRVVQCLPCKAKRATLSGNSVVVTSADTNNTEMIRIARANGIKHFMDIAFAYQPTGMILSFNIQDSESNNVIWSRSYNSETSRASAFRKGIDYSQVEEARNQNDYKPTVQYRIISYYLFERNILSYTGTVGLGFRMVERYDNRHKEVGFELNYIRDVTSLAGGPDLTKNIYSGFNLTMLFVHAWNLIGNVENYNSVRGSLYTAIGGTFASGFLGGLLRLGYEWRLGKHWAAAAILGYRPLATAFIDSTDGISVSGLEFGMGVSALF